MFDDAASFDRAIKRAIKASGKNPGEAYRQMLRDRFLCRVFINSSQYVLKGGSGMLARITDSRTTRDIDLDLVEKASAEVVIQDLKTMVERDMGDWCRFVLDKYEETPDENGYSRLLKLRFSSYIGEQEKDPILIDLSLGSVITDSPQKITPVSRVEVDELAVSDYLVYPIADHIAEKVCAVVEQHNGRSSSRVKDLVDLVMIALHETVLGSKLQTALRSEFAKRQLAMIASFRIPDTWITQYPKVARQTFLEEPYLNSDSAVKLVRKMIDPALRNLVTRKQWSPVEQSWL